QLELGFSQALKGALVSIVDPQTGYQFLRDEAAPKTLFRLAARRPESTELEWVDSHEAGAFSWSQVEGQGEKTLVLECSAFVERDLTVRVEVTLPDGAALSTWRMHVSGLGDHTLCQLTCPLVAGAFKVGEAAPGESLVTPWFGEGYVFRDPYPVVDRLPLKAGEGPDTPAVGLGRVEGRYPGAMPMQFLLYYTDDAGLYLATHDSSQQVKTFAVGETTGWEGMPVMSIAHLSGEAFGADVSFDYDTVVGVFHGDWYDGADIYKAWARQQWWCARTLQDKDLGDWLRQGFGVFQMSNYHMPELKLNHSMDEIATLVNELSEGAGAPILALVFNFEAGGAWTGPVGLLPPREGTEPFRAAMEKLRAAGNRGFIYVPGGNWYIAIESHDPPFDSWAEFEADGRACAILEVDRQVHISTWYAGWCGARLCPALEYIHDLTVDMVLGYIDLGCTVVQIDNFPCCSAQACYEEKHGHPLGYGAWWSEAWNGILADVRRAAKARDPEAAISTEAITENFIPYLDMYDQRSGNSEYFVGRRMGNSPMGGENIALFNYIYNPYIGSYLAAYPESNRPEVLYWTRSLGKALTQGVLPTGGRYFPEPPGLNPITIAFYKKVVRAAAQECWPYIVFGDMLRPPEIAVPQITASYLRQTPDCDHLDPAKRHVVVDDAVQHSSWRGP
ncbi:MAG: hypothetical protein GX597_08025, partial [Anaerolineaceae bacterium]|nr:hypothetical protein [Anaerolineaceae bacterium]